MIAVTGADGFVGRATCAMLTAQGIGHRGLTRSAKAGTTMVGDIGPSTDWRAALSGVDTVVHLASRVHVLRERSRDPAAEFRNVNVRGTLRLAEQAAVHGVRRFVFMSSVKVMGERTRPGHPFTVADMPAPVDAYGRSKLEAELGLQDLASRTGIELVIIRPPLVYGAGVRANFRLLIRAVSAGVPLPFAAVRNRRSLMAVSNLADLIRRCIQHPDAPGGTFLASDGADISTPDLLRAVGRAVGRPARLFAAPPVLLRTAGTLTGQGAAIDRLLDSLQVDIAETCRRLEWTPPFRMGAALADAAATGW